jgi:hypothetical protein
MTIDPLISREECEAIRDDLADAGGAFTELVERVQWMLEAMNEKGELEATLGIIHRVSPEVALEAVEAEAAASRLLLLCELLGHQLSIMEKDIADARHAATTLFYWVREDSPSEDVANWSTRRAGQLRERAARLERPLGGRAEQA